MNVRSLVIGFGANTQNFSAGAKLVKNELAALDTQFRANKKETSALQKEYDETNKQLRLLSAAMKMTGGTEKQIAEFQQLSEKLDVTSVKLGKVKANQTELKNQIGMANAELKKYQEGMRGVGNESEKASKTISNFGTAIKALVLGYTGKRLFDYLIGSNAEMEQYLTSFEVMLGDAGKAKKLMEDLTKFTAATPLEQDGVVKNAQLLMNYGVAADDVIKKMTDLGNLSQGNEEKLGRVSLAYGQMLAKGKVTGEELRQMTEAGVPLLSALAESLEVSTAKLQKMISDGKVGIPELDAAIKSLTTGSGQFAGMMEKQSKSMNGLLSTLRDEFVQFGREAGAEGFGEVKDTIADVLEEVKAARASGELAKLASDIGNGVAGTIKLFVGAVKTLWQWRDAIAASAAAMVAFKSVMTMHSVISTAVKAINDYKKATDAATVSQGMLNTVMLSAPWMMAAALAAACVGAFTLMAIKNDVLTNSIDASAKSLDRMNNLLDDAREQGTSYADIETKNIGVLESKAKIYEELRTKINRTADEERMLKEVVNDLQELMPASISLIDKETGAYHSKADAIDRVISKMRAEILLKSKESEYTWAITNKDKLKEEIDKASTNKPAIDYSDEWGSVPLMTVWQMEKANKNLESAKKQYAEAIKIEQEYEQMLKDFYTEYPSTSTKTKPTLSGDDDGKKKENPLVTKSKKAYEDLRFLRSADMISEDEYLKDLTKLRDNAKKLDGDLYRKYYLEVYNIQKTANEAMLTEEQKAADELAKTKQKEFADWIKSSKKAYDDLYKDRIDRINAEIKAEEKRVSKLIAGIDAEIKARQRLKEETDANKQIDAVKAKLQYAQLDDFSRMELERELAKLQQEKSDREWLNSKEDEKDSLRAQLDRYKEIAEQQKEMFAEEKERMQEIFEFISENFTTLEQLQTAGIVGVFGLIQTKTTETAEMYSSVVGNKIDATFDHAMTKARAVIAELQNAVAYAKEQTAATIASINRAKSEAQKIINSTVVNNNITNPNLTGDQITKKITGSLASSLYEMR